MKYEDLIIVGLPKTFDVWDLVEYLQPETELVNPDNIVYDAYPAECDEEKGEDAIALFKYNESATGVVLVHNPQLQSLSLWLSPWAVEADVLLYAAIVGAVPAKHRKAHLYEKYAPLKGLTDDDVQRMIADRKKHLKKLLATTDGFTMEGLNASYTLVVAHLRPAASPDMQVLELQNAFVRMQWEDDEE